MKKINFWVIGAPGTGKTTFSNKLSTIINSPVFHLDDLYWIENWERNDIDEFRKSVKNCVTNSSWIIDGYYPEASDIVEEYCNNIILLHLPKHIIVFRIIKRSILGALFNKSVCGKNKESIHRLFGKNGLIKYAMKQYDFYRNKINQKNIILLRNKTEIKNYLDNVKDLK